MFEPLIVVAGVLLGGVFLDWRQRSWRNKQQGLLQARMPELLRRASAQLTSGQSSTQVIQRLLGDLSISVQPALQPVDWLAHARKQTGLKELSHLQSLVQHVAEHGGNLAQHLDEMAARLNEQAQARSLAVIAMAPVRSQAKMVLYIIPVLIGLVFFLEPEATSKLFTTYTGLAILGACGALNVGIWYSFSLMSRVQL